jgi:hypothetical protein
LKPGARRLFPGVEVPGEPAEPALLVPPRSFPPVAPGLELEPPEGERPPDGSGPEPAEDGVAVEPPVEGVAVEPPVEGVAVEPPVESIEPEPALLGLCVEPTSPDAGAGPSLEPPLPGV